MHSRFKRGVTLGACTVLALVAGLLAVTPANAAPPFAAANFHPQNTVLNTDSDPTDATANAAPDRMLLSDRFDGVDSAAHITSVATGDADRAIYVICPEGALAATTAVPPPGCQIIGTDTAGSPAPTTGGPPGSIGDEGYEFFWEIPGTFDFITRDFVSYHCNGAPTAAEPGGNCLREEEDKVVIDDGQTGSASSSAELFDWCVNQNGGVDSLCDDPGDSRTHSFDHPESIPNLSGAQELIVRARASSNVSLLTLCVDTTADAQQAPNACSISDSAATSAAPAFGTATFVVTHPNSSEMSFFLYEREVGGTADDGVCAAANPQPGGAPAAVGGDVDCVLDNHYVVSVPRTIALTHAHNDEDFPTYGDQGPTFCEDQSRLKTGDVPTGTSDEVVGCIFDQFSEAADSDASGDQEQDPAGSQALPATFVAPAGWGFQSAGACANAGAGSTRHDHNNDGLFEHCHVTAASYTANAQGTLIVAADATATTGGQGTITFCSDPEAGQAQNTTDPTHGCSNAGSAGSDSVNKNGVPTIDHNHLRTAGDATTDPTCHTGAASVNAPASSSVPLKGCVHDQFHNGAANVPVIWRIGTGAQDPAQFVGTPDQTTDAQGIADATFTAPANAAGQFSNIFFCGDLDADGICDTAAAQFQISWTQAPGGGPGPTGQNCPNGFDNVRGTRGNDKIKGDRGCDKIRGIAGDDKLVGRAGDDRLIGGPGNDRLVGGPGFDICSGNQGRDRFKGCERIKKR